MGRQCLATPDANGFGRQRARKLAELLELLVPPRGPLAGRVLTEALSVNGSAPAVPAATSRIIESKPDPKHHLVTRLKVQALGEQTYLDAGGFSGRTVGLESP